MLICDRTLEPETAALFGRGGSIGPNWFNTPRTELVNDTIRRLKNAYLWSKLDLIQIYAAHDANMATRNWKSTSYLAIPTNAPTFTVDVGYTTATTGSKYVDTGYNPTTSSLFTQNAAYFAIWLLDDTTSSTSAAGAFSTDGVTINNGNATPVATHRMNQVTVTNGAGGSSSGRGLWGVSRSNSTTTALRKNGVLVTAGGQTSTAVRSQNMLIGGTSGAVIRNSIYGGAFAGTVLTAAEEVLLYTITRDYLLAVNAATGI